MKKNKQKQQKLVDKSVSELKSLLKKTQEKWLNLRMDLKIGKLKNVHESKKVRKEIAKIKTVLKEKELIVKKS